MNDNLNPLKPPEGELGGFHLALGWAWVSGAAFGLMPVLGLVPSLAGAGLGYAAAVFVGWRAGIGFGSEPEQADEPEAAGGA